MDQCKSRTRRGGACIICGFFHYGGFSLVVGEEVDPPATSSDNNEIPVCNAGSLDDKRNHESL